MIKKFLRDTALSIVVVTAAFIIGLVWGVTVLIAAGVIGFIALGISLFIFWLNFHK